MRKTTTIILDLPIRSLLKLNKYTCICLIAAMISTGIIGCGLFYNIKIDSTSDKKVLFLYAQIQNMYANDTCNFIGYGIGRDKNNSIAYQIAETNAWNNLTESIKVHVSAILEIVKEDVKDISVEDEKISSSSIIFPHYVKPDIFYSDIESDSVSVVAVVIVYARNDYYEYNLYPHLQTLKPNR